MRVEQLQREYPVRVTWLPFELHPETPPEGRVRTPSGRPSPVAAAAEAAGLQMTSPSLVANSRLALEATEAVREAAPSRVDASHRAVFAVYFAEGENIGDSDVLTHLAEKAGVDGVAVRAAIEDRRFRERVDDLIQWSADHGIASTPTFVFDNRLAIVGAQDYSLIESLMTRLDTSRRSDE